MVMAIERDRPAGRQAIGDAMEPVGEGEDGADDGADGQAEGHG